MSESEQRIVVNDYAFLDLAEPTITLFANNDRQSILILAQGDISHLPLIDPQAGPQILIDEKNRQEHPVVALAFDTAADVDEFIDMLQTLRQHMTAARQAQA
jgi:hypothetical protein